MTSSPLARYAPALIQIAIVLVGALAQLRGHLTLVDGLQLVPLAVNALTVYLAPLLRPAARSGWKTGAAVIGALVAAAVPITAAIVAGGHVTGAQIAIVLLAGLQALGAHIGVQIRNDAATFAVSTDGVATRTSTATARAPEPPAETTVNRAITDAGGEFLGDPAR